MKLCYQPGWRDVDAFVHIRTRASTASCKIFLMRTLAVSTLVLVLVTAAACAPKTIAVPVVTVPRFPEFARPEVPAALTGTDAVLMYDRAWRFLQAGDFRSAERDLAVALSTTPTFYPAEAASGYVALAQSDAEAAVASFDRALARQPDYTSALVGKGHALLALNRESEAIAAFESALSSEPCAHRSPPAHRGAAVPERRTRSCRRETGGTGRASRRGHPSVHRGDRELARERVPVPRAGGC